MARRILARHLSSRPRQPQRRLATRGAAPPVLQVDRCTSGTCVPTSAPDQHIDTVWGSHLVGLTQIVGGEFLERPIC